ncbi:MAG: adventurous gliding motility TPR repeat lipoprotein GltE [Anaeromyxobacter sp.]
MTTRRISISTLLLAATLACAGGGAAPRGQATAAARPGAKAGAAPAPAAAPEVVSARAERLFAEAVQAEADQRKLKVPTDWVLLERKWRAVLDASEIPEARFNLGVTLEGQGRLAEARAEYERARQVKPSLRQASLNLAVLTEKTGDAHLAQAAYAGVVRDFPEDGRARERLAALYLESGQLDEAWRLSREALLRDARATGAYRVMARVALRRDQGDLARLLVLRAQKVEANDPELAFLMGQALDKGGDDAGAAAQWNKALALDPHHLPARYALLSAALQAQRWSAVVEQGQALQKDAPDDAAVQLALGVAYRHLGEADPALAALARAEQAGAGRLPEVNLARGVLFMRVKEECEPALVEFRKYRQAAGPMATTDSQVLKLERECEGILAENRKALEAARQLQQQADQKKAAAPGAAARPAPAAEEDPLALPPAVPLPTEPDAPAAPQGKKP